MTELTHLDDSGEARMVDVSSKVVTDRVAVAEARVVMSESTRRMLFDGALPKGEALPVARIAAIGAAKRTSDLIPLCHPLPLAGVDVFIEEVPSGARIEVTAKVSGRTGVEMEALTGAAIGALTIYDMVKAVERGATIEGVRLLHKSGGKSGEWSA